MSTHSSLITISNPKSPITEAYRTLQTNINFSSSDNKIKTLVITSPGAAEGKSTTAANLAITYSQMGCKTLLIDADLHCPMIHSLFELSNQNGLSNILCLKEELGEIKQEVNPLLDVVTTGPIPPNPAEFLSSKGLEQFIHQVRESYDMVIFDTPPVGILTDAALVGAKVDGTLLVVASSKSEMKLAQKAKENLMNVKANILGSVLTMFPVKESEYYHYYTAYGSESSHAKKRRFGFGRRKK